MIRLCDRLGSVSVYSRAPGNIIDTQERIIIAVGLFTQSELRASRFHRQFANGDIGARPAASSPTTSGSRRHELG
jgi:hypothetical protein